MTTFEAIGTLYGLRDEILEAMKRHDKDVAEANKRGGKPESFDSWMEEKQRERKERVAAIEKICGMVVKR